MFTGIVEEIGTVVAVERHPSHDTDAPEGDARLAVRGALVTSDVALGDSISVDGVCLTVAHLPGDGSFVADVMPETLRRSSLGDLTVGSRVNLERALPVAGRFGGHVVQGHVDGVGRVRERRPGPRWDEVSIEVEDPALLRYVVEKGSITVSGVSLTVAAVDDDAFGVSLIPTTLEVTTLGGLAPGARVNLEVDVLAKYVERLLGAAGRLS